jgi:hypothetical protein
MVIVHDVQIKSVQGRDFVLDIVEKGTGYESRVTIIDSISEPKESWACEITPATSSSTDNYKAGIESIKKYLAKKGGDSIKDIHNPCNCPLISQEDQHKILSELGNDDVNIRVN